MGPGENDRHHEHLPYTTAATVGQEHARATWALAARERLIETAGEYHAVVNSKELAEFVQRRSLIRTSQLPQSWIGDVLRRVSTECVRRGEPLLASLCVDAKGRVAAAYAAAAEELRGESVGNPDEHAARERLECYRRFGAELPPGGGVPGPLVPASVSGPRASATSPRTPRTPARPKRPARPVVEEKPLQTCPVHFTVLPANGVCDLCE